jgi:DNA-binding NtrC family response regulator
MNMLRKTALTHTKQPHMRRATVAASLIVPNRGAASKVLLVDDEVQHLELRAAMMRAQGLSVITTSDPMKTMAIVAQARETIGMAVLDYDMPVMNGCLLAKHIRSMLPELRIILYSGAVDIPENEMESVDAFISKSAGVPALLKQIAEFA